jgi:signal transduction histidine kinase
MSAEQFLTFFTQAVFVIVLAVMIRNAIRRPRRAQIDIALFFAAIVAELAIGDAEAAFGINGHPVLRAVSLALIISLPYLLLRLVDDFTGQPAWLMRVAAASWILLVAISILVPSLLNVPFVAVHIAWVVLLGGYSSLAFLRYGGKTTGVTRRRMTAVAVGSGCIAVVFLLGGIAAFEPAASTVTGILSSLAAVTCGIAYFVGFAPPAILRRAWQEPELRAFLQRAAALPRLPDSLTTMRQIERGAAQATGASGASLGIWDAERDRLVYVDENDLRYELPADVGIGGRVFVEQRAIFADNLAAQDPDRAEMYRAYGVDTLLAAPVSVGEKRIGVLATYAANAPIFADDDLRLVQLLADQAGVILENRSLIEEHARVQAREEAARLKDDFLSAAAHDLRTPLTTLLLHAEMLRRQIDRDPTAPTDARRVETIVREGNRLKGLVTDFLDAARAERGQLLGTLDLVDLVPLMRDTAEVHATPRHRVRIEADGPVMSRVDSDRMRQLFDNLVENAIKYTPDGGEIVMRARSVDGGIELSVSDNGIGIPTDDLPHLFQRFHRGTNVDDRRFHGLGLGLYICRTIVEEHGGTIRVTSALGTGTTMHVSLPLGEPVPEVEQPASVALEPAAGPIIPDGAAGLADA